MTAEDFKHAMQDHAISSDADFLQRFFKTGKGQYGAGDVFIGVRVPQTRAVCKKFKNLPLTEVEKLLQSEVHEYRLAAVIMLADRYKKASSHDKQAIYDLYLKGVYEGYVNNWDIVDSSAEFIIGPHLEGKPKELLFTLAKNESLWQRRVAMLSTFAYIKKGESDVALQLAEKLLHDKQNLIQKAVGWMLREIGKRCSEQILTNFLEKHYKTMPRTMLRYAIERLSPELKVYFMQK